MTTSSAPFSELDGMAAALNAIRNVSRAPVIPVEVAEILATGRGRPAHVRALFGDLSLDALMRLAIALDLPTATLRAAYATARDEAAGANPEIDALSP